MSGPPAEPAASFADLGLPEPVLRALETLGYETPSPIQAAAIPVLLAGQDLIGQAQTGTGKTAAFALPLLARLDLDARAPQVLVLTPTRELAIQVAEAFQSYARFLPGFHVLPLYGGQSMGGQLRALQRPVHVIVGTPGRIMDHLRRASLDLGRLHALVLDEADEMLRMGFLEEVTWILEHTPAARQTALFSATLPEPIRVVAQQTLRAPAEVKIKARTRTVESIRQRYWPVSGLHKLDALTRILEIEDTDAVLVFVRTKIATTELATKLEARGYACAALHGDLNQAQRERTVEQLRQGELDLVVATDVAARGLDVPRISHVINYDIPYDIEGYIHRIGRTGRAGRAGEAILFVAPREVRMLRAIERATRQTIVPMRAPSREAIAEHRVGQFKQRVFDVLASEDLEFFGVLVDELVHERGVAMRDVAAAVSFLAQRERPLQVPARETSGAGPEQPTPARATRTRPPAREQEVLPAAVFADAVPARRAARTPAREPAARSTAAIPLVRYRIEVGARQGVTAKYIVGAIANEAGIDSRYIGRIEIGEDSSVVELPDDMPRDVLQRLRRIHLGKHRFALQPVSDTEPLQGRSKPSAGRPAARGKPRPAHKRRS
jgi:ATP-dependent RNA helicase DeaD